MMKLILFFCCCLIACSALAERPRLSVVFEHNPPFQTIDANNKGHGPIIDFAELLITVAKENADFKAEFNGKPWARIMERDAYHPNILILSMSKTPQREPHFTWLTQVYTGQQYIWKVKGRADPEGRALQVAVERNAHKMMSIKHHFGEDNIHKSLNSAQALHALLKGRVDRFVGTVFAVSGKLQSLGHNMNELQRMAKFDDTGFASQGLSFALTLDTDEYLEAALRKALKDPKVEQARAKLQKQFEASERQLMMGL
ncbi:substrate-binding periplasmic protein [Pseudoalteromonas sp. SS15]|uniref:substrate-binding periplasmic protein n=1 Tax=Pseudoalteromonas sp. SS15 TaxID=3139393 RepID=UPI003BA87538